MMLTSKYRGGEGEKISGEKTIGALPALRCTCPAIPLTPEWRLAGLAGQHEQKVSDKPVQQGHAGAGGHRDEITARCGSVEGRRSLI